MKNTKIIKNIIIIILLLTVFISKFNCFDIYDFWVNDYNTPGTINEIYSRYDDFTGGSYCILGTISYKDKKVLDRAHNHDNHIKVIYKCSKKLHKPVHKDLIMYKGGDVLPGKNFTSTTEESLKESKTITIKDELMNLKELMKIILKNSPIKYIGTSLVAFSCLVADYIFNKGRISKYSLKERSNGNSYEYSLTVKPKPNLEIPNNTGETVRVCLAIIKTYEIYLQYEFKAEFHKKKIYDEDDGRYTEKYTFLGYRLVKKYIFLQDKMTTTDHFFVSEHGNVYYSNCRRINDDENICIFM